MKTTSLFVPLITTALVSAHGFVRTLTVAGKAYTGNIPGSKSTDSVIRTISTQDPVKRATNPSLTCGQHSIKAADTANANPGDALTFAWKEADLSNWPHDTGPLMTYLSPCGGPCSNVTNIQDLKWFKIDQVGKISDDGDWFQKRLMKGATSNVTLPSNLAPGNYFVRHEIIALHLAVNLYGAEFYPSCSQIKVGGSETGAPTDKELVKFPGAYSDKDPGIFDPGVFDDGPYTFPGPPIAAFVNGKHSSSLYNDQNNTPTSTGSAPSAQTSNSRKKKKTLTTCNTTTD